METIKVFTGMEVHGEVEMVVLKTFVNGTKLCWFDHRNEDEDESWDELWIAQPNPYSHINAEWYGIDSQDVRVDLTGGNYCSYCIREFKSSFMD